MLPNAGPGLREPDEAPGKDARAIAEALAEPGRDARAIAEALAEGELAALTCSRQILCMSCLTANWSIRLRGALAQRGFGRRPQWRFGRSRRP